MKEGDFNEVIKRMHAHMACTIGDAWDETLDGEGEFVVENRTLEHLAGIPAGNTRRLSIGK